MEDIRRIEDEVQKELANVINLILSINWLQNLVNSILYNFSIIEANKTWRAKRWQVGGLKRATKKQPTIINQKKKDRQPKKNDDNKIYFLLI